MTIYHLSGERWTEAGAGRTVHPIDEGRLGRFTDRLGELRGVLGGVEPRWAERLARLGEELGRDETTLVFGGHFKSGKSTLLNALLGRDLLPVDSLPETGALCVLRSATADRGRVFENGDHRPVACETGAIRREVALLDEAGQQRHRIEEIDRLELELAGVVIPPGHRWIDSPGINDTEVMNRCARRASRQGDLLLWILASRQMLSEVEMAFLAEEIAHSGPASVVFVLNFFLDSDGIEEWRRGIERQLPFLLEKVTEFSADLGFTEAQPPAVVAVAGRALGASADGHFGGAGLRRFLLDGGPEIAARRARSRSHRAWSVLREIRRELAEAVEREEERLAEERREIAARRAAAKTDSKAFQRELERALGRLKSEWRAGVENAAKDVVMAVCDPLERDDTYSERLNRSLGALGKETRREFIGAVSEAAHRHRQRALPRAVRQKIGRRLTPGKLRVVVANNDVESGGWIGGALAGAAAGTAVPIIGTFFGALAGAAAGATMATQASIEKDVKETRANARRTARSAAGLVDEKEEKIRRTILEHCRPVDVGPKKANAAPLARLREIATLLEQAIEEARGLAAAPL